MNPISFSIFIIVGISIFGGIGLYVLKIIEQNAVMENELKEAGDDEKKSQEALDIASRPDDNADTLIERMRDGK